MTLVEFLRARLDATDEECEGAGEYGDCRDLSDLRHREIEAKRQIIAEHYPVDPCDAHDGVFTSILCPTLRILALPYADHPSYDEAWRP